jgi:hypothetical protein
VPSQPPVPPPGQPARGQPLLPRLARLTRDQSHLVIPTLLIVSGWLVLGMTAVGSMQVVRPVAVFAFALAVPGIAVVRLLPLRDPLERAVLAVAISLSLATLAAEAAYIGRVLHPAVVLAMLAAACSVTAGMELTRGVRRGC